VKAGRRTVIVDRETEKRRVRGAEKGCERGGETDVLVTFIRMRAEG
jgi:hypothetical protein